jgi:hypothetical protein
LNTVDINAQLGKMNMNVLKMLETNTHALESFFDATQERAATINRKVIHAAQKNLELGFDFVGSLSRARTFSEVIESQATYSRKQFDALTAQADEIRKWLFGFVAPESQASASPLKHTGKVPSHARKTSTTRYNVSEGTITALEKRIGTQKFEAPFPPEIKSCSETERKTPKVSVLEAKSKPLQKLRTAGGEKQRPEPATKVKRRPPSSDKKIPDGAETAPVSPDPKMEVKFGMLDGNAVRFTDSEAWWLVDGIWCRSSSDEVIPNVVEMRKARFDKLFPRVPPLPSNAFLGITAPAR